MSGKILVRRDTAAWVGQVWIAFITSVIASVGGILSLGAPQLEGAFLGLGFLFCVSAALVLSKTLRDNQHEQVDTAAWRMFVWIAFAAAVLVTVWGLLGMALESWQRAYVAVSWLFLINTSFTLSKTLRDQFEARLLDAPGAEI